MVDKKAGAAFIAFMIIAAIGITIVAQVFLSTAPSIILSSATNPVNDTGPGVSAGQLENLSVTGQTVASFIPLIYMVLPLAFIGGAIAAAIIVGRKVFN